MVERAIAFVCSRNHLSQSDADDFSSYVTLRMVEDDYAVFSSFQRRASLRTYLTVVIQRMLLDYRVRAWGRWRPSAEAKRCGPLAIRLEELLVRDGCRLEEAYEMLKTNHGLTVTRDELERLAAAPAVAHAAALRVGRRAGGRGRGGSGGRRAGDGKRIVRKRRRACRACCREVMAGLEQQDRLILVLKFEDGRTVADIAATLRLEQKALYRHEEKLL